MAEGHQKMIRGTTVASTLVDKILRQRIYKSTFWKERCFGLTEETLVDRAVELNHFGGTYGGARKPTDFLCLLLKMLQMKPDREIVMTFLTNDEHKYARVLGAFYWRLTSTPVEAYNVLEQLLTDMRKVRKRVVGGWELTTIDSVVDELLTGKLLCDITLPTLPVRISLERSGVLPPRVSVLQAEFDAMSPEERERAAGNAVVASSGQENPSQKPSSSTGHSGATAGHHEDGRPSKRPRIEEDRGEPIEVLLNDRLGKKVRVKCFEHDLVLDLKKLAAAQTGTRPEKLRLQKWSTIFKDHIRLSDYEIRSGMSIELYYN